MTVAQALLAYVLAAGLLTITPGLDTALILRNHGTLTVGETIKSWSVMETVISVFGFALVMLVSVFV